MFITGRHVPGTAHIAALCARAVSYGCAIKARASTHFHASVSGITMATNFTRSLWRANKYVWKHLVTHESASCHWVKRILEIHQCLSHHKFYQRKGSLPASRTRHNPIKGGLASHLIITLEIWIYESWYDGHTDFNIKTHNDKNHVYFTH